MKNADEAYAETDFAEGAKFDYTIEITEDIVLPTPQNAPADAPNFVAWYTDKDCTTAVVDNKIAKGSTGDKTFYARWSATAVVNRTVTFKFVGGEGLTDATANVVDGDKITVETAKAKIHADYEAAGESFLFSDEGCATAFDIATAITADTTIYVKVSQKTPPADSGNSGGNENTGGESGGNTQNPPPQDTAKTFVPLKNSNIYASIIVKPDVTKVPDENKDIMIDKATENADGSITFTTTGVWAGGGMGFYLKEDKSAVNLKDYSKAKIILSSTDANTPVLIDFYKNATPTDPKNKFGSGGLAEKYLKYDQTAKANEDKTIEVDFSIITETTLEAYGIRVKLNWHQKEPAKAIKTLTIKSIELVK